MTCDEAAGSPEGEQTERIAGAIKSEVLSASIAGRESVSLSIRITGAFERPGARATLEQTVIVATVPARIVPA